MNKIILKGNLARDPEIKVLELNGRKVTVANLVIATSRFFKRADGTKDKDTTFIPCEAWDTGAETIGKYVVKGDPLLIEGSLKVESWEKDGQKMSRMKVRIGSFERLYKSSRPYTGDTSETVVEQEEVVDSI
jgi:single-strand DNA-binding protein